MATKTFNICVNMEERWIPYFKSFLSYMQKMGSIGHSGLVGFYADGDGDFRPKFDFDIPINNVNGILKETLLKNHKNDYNQITTSFNIIPEIMFDAG